MKSPRGFGDFVIWRILDLAIWVQVQIHSMNDNNARQITGETVWIFLLIQSLGLKPSSTQDKKGRKEEEENIT